jgi:hypothetical protein
MKPLEKIGHSKPFQSLFPPSSAKLSPGWSDRWWFEMMTFA